MLLANYFRWFKTASDVDNQSNLNSAVVNLDNQLIYMYHNYTNSTGYSNQAVRNYAYYDLKLRFGLGNTQPAITDYCMANDITNDNDIVINSQSVTANNNNNSIEYVFIANLTNTSDTDLVIKEIGITKEIYGSLTPNSWSTGAHWPSLFSRDVLDAPVTLRAGETKTVKYIWTIS